jgi:hypothetical protein
MSRPPRPDEAISLVLGALATLGQLSGVKATNIEVDGKKVAVAVIDGARFDEDENGNTTLNKIEE